MTREWQKGGPSRRRPQDGARLSKVMHRNVGVVDPPPTGYDYAGDLDEMGKPITAPRAVGGASYAGGHLVTLPASPIAIRRSGQGLQASLPARGNRGVQTATQISSPPPTLPSQRDFPILKSRHNPSTHPAG